MSGRSPMTEILPHQAEIREGDGRHPGFVLPPSMGSEWSQICVDKTALVLDHRCPMARIRTAERKLQGRPLLSFGALACTPGHYLESENQPGRRELANSGEPVVRW